MGGRNNRFNRYAERLADGWEGLEAKKNLKKNRYLHREQAKKGGARLDIGGQTMQTSPK